MDRKILLLGAYFNSHLEKHFLTTDKISLKKKSLHLSILIIYAHFYKLEKRNTR